MKINFYDDVGNHKKWDCDEKEEEKFRSNASSHTKLLTIKIWTLRKLFVWLSLYSSLNWKNISWEKC